MAFQVGDLVGITSLPGIQGLVVAGPLDTDDGVQTEDGTIAWKGGYVVLVLAKANSGSAPPSSVWKHMKTTAESDTTLTLVKRLLP